jgi:hypothetical protein
MRTDQAVQEDVEQELQWHPNLDTTNIAVSVKDGAVANDLEVRLPATDERPDPDIARVDDARPGGEMARRGVQFANEPYSGRRFKFSGVDGMARGRRP